MGDPRTIGSADGASKHAEACYINKI
jgi:hypothetical protein